MRVLIYHDVDETQGLCTRDSGDLHVFAPLAACSTQNPAEGSSLYWETQVRLASLCVDALPR